MGAKAAEVRPQTWAGSTSTSRPTKLRVHNLRAIAALLGKTEAELETAQQAKSQPQGRKAPGHAPHHEGPSSRSAPPAHRGRGAPVEGDSPCSTSQSPQAQLVSTDSFNAHMFGGSGVPERIAAQHALREKQQRAREEEQRAAVKRIIEEKKRRTEIASAKMFAEVFAGLDYDEGVTGEISETLLQHQKIKSQKQRRLHADWKAEVYDKITARIQAAVDKRDIKDVEQRLRSNYQDYITTTNNKLAVFRDVIIEADYNPLHYRTQNIRYEDRDINDPVKRDILKAKRDAAVDAANVQMGGGAVEDKHPGKVTLQTTMWDKLESTPYGRNMDRQGNYVLKPPNEKLVKLRASHIPMDHYTFPVGQEAVAAELPVGKAPVYPKPGDPWRKDLFDVIQRLDENKTFAQLKAENKTQGDVWLGYRGRRVPPGPELRRGRKNLYDVIHHTCVEGLKKNPHFTGGDEWLERKGKRSVPGPEQRRGRKNLFETFQQSSNPFVDGRTLDDIFLERRGKKNVPFFNGTNMYKIIQDQDIEVAQAPQEVARHYISELIPVDGSLTTRTVPSLTTRAP